MDDIDDDTEDDDINDIINNNNENITDDTMPKQYIEPPPLQKLKITVIERSKYNKNKLKELCGKYGLYRCGLKSELNERLLDPNNVNSTLRVYLCVHCLIIKIVLILNADRCTYIFMVYVCTHSYYMYIVILWSRIVCSIHK